MPRVVGQKTAIGATANGDCQGCLEPFAKSDRMTGVSEGREFKGWFCDQCICNWNPPVDGAEIAEHPSPLLDVDESEKPRTQKGNTHGRDTNVMDRKNQTPPRDLHGRPKADNPGRL